MFQNPSNAVNVIIPHVIYYTALCVAKWQFFLPSHGNVTLTCAMLPCDDACVRTHIRISESFTIYLLIENKNEKRFQDSSPIVRYNLINNDLAEVDSAFV